MITGRLPFEADTIRAVLFQQAAVTVTPVRELRPDVPAPLAKVIERALEKDPVLRYRTMDAFSEALARVASEVAGEFRIGRRVPPMSERWVLARQAQASSRAWLVMAVLGLAAFAVAFPKAESVLLRRFAGTREEATFTARSWLRSQGVQGPIAMRRDLVTSVEHYDFLQRALPRDSADARAASDVHAWYWDLTFHPESGSDSWWIYVGHGNRLMRTYHWLADTAARADLGPDSSRAIAERELAARGWKETLVPLSAGVSPGVRRTERSFTYAVPGRHIQLGGDTALFSVTAGVTGGEIVRVAESLRLPRGFQSGLSRGARSALGAAGLAILVGIFFSALAIVVRRSARDTLQWRTAAALGAVAPVVVLGTFVLPLMPAQIVSFDSTASRFTMAVSHLLNNSPDVLAPWAVITVMLLAAESLLYELRPDISAGLADLSHGRVSIPELVPAALTGYAIGAVMLGSGYAILAVLRATGVLPYAAVLSLGWSMEVALPALAVLHALAGACLVAAIAYFFVACALSTRRPWALPAACLATGLTAALFRFSESSAPAIQIAMEGIAFSIAAWVLYRHGVLTAVVALFVLMGMPVAGDLLLTGSDPFVWSGITGIVMIMTPAVLALLVWRRRPGARLVST
jgi:hypothetical protein